MISDGAKTSILERVNPMFKRRILRKLLITHNNPIENKRHIVVSIHRKHIFRTKPRKRIKLSTSHIKTKKKKSLIS